MVKVLNIIKVLIGFHAFSRCDQTGKFHGYRKKSFQQTPLRSPDVLDTFGRLGNDEPPIKTNLTKFEKLVLKKTQADSVYTHSCCLEEKGFQSTLYHHTAEICQH